MGSRRWEAHTMAEGRAALQTHVFQQTQQPEVDRCPTPRPKRTSIDIAAISSSPPWESAGRPLVGRRGLQFRVIIFSIKVIPTYSFETINQNRASCLIEATSEHF